MRMTSERAEGAMTTPGARWLSTVRPPRPAWATTPSGRATANHARSLRNGRRRIAMTNVTTVRIPTTKPTTRLPNSISACVLSGGSGVPPHLGQFSQPSPESVSRTPAPLSTINVSATSVALAAIRNCRGVTVRRVRRERRSGIGIDVGQRAGTLGERRGGLVPFGRDQFEIVRPRDRHLRIVVGEAGLGSRVVVGRDLVGDIGDVAQDAEPVGEPVGDE